jgi:hypothetical protein
MINFRKIHKAAVDGHKAMMEHHDQLIAQIHESATPAIEAKETIDAFIPHIMNIQNLTQHLKATACQTHQVNPEDQPSVNAQPKKAACWGNVRINHDFKPSTNPYTIPVQEPDRQGYQDRQTSQNTAQNPPALQSTNTAPTLAANGISHPRFTPIDGLPNQHNIPSGQIP